jgi:DNA ligase-4
MRFSTSLQRTWANSKPFGFRFLLASTEHRNRDLQSKILQRVYNRSTADEQKWIVRIILKGWHFKFLKDSFLTVFTDMHISVKETTIFSVFHPDAQDLYNTCSDLKKVAWELWDPSFRLNDEVSLHHLNITALPFIRIIE